MVDVRIFKTRDRPVIVTGHNVTTIVRDLLQDLSHFFAEQLGSVHEANNGSLRLFIIPLTTTIKDGITTNGTYNVQTILNRFIKTRVSSNISDIGTMGLIHTPRTMYSILNGVYKRQIFLRQQVPTPTASSTVIGIPKNTMTIGLGQTNPHIYQARLGLFDIDYLGHMNNGMFFELIGAIVLIVS